MNKHLQRLIQKHLTHIDWVENVNYKHFVDAVNESFKSYDQDSTISQRAFDLADKEYQKVTHALLTEKNLRERSIKTLLNAIASIEGNEHVNLDGSNLLTIAEYLENQINLRKHAEVLLKESEGNFKQINETINDVFWLYDTIQQRYLYISPSCLDLFGISQQMFYDDGHLLQKLVTPKYTKYFSDEESPLTELGVYDFQYQVKTTDGTIKWIREKSSAIRNNSGEVIRRSGICSDITVSHETEKELKQLSLVAQKATNGIAITNTDGSVLWANQGYLNMFGVTSDQITNRKPRDLFNSGEESFHEKINEINARDFALEFETRKMSGEKIWVRLNNSVVHDEEGNPVQQIEVLTDITDRKQSEMKLRGIIDLVPHFIFVKDEKGKYVLANQAFTNALGCSPEYLIGKSDFDFHSHQEAEKFMKEDQETIALDKEKKIEETFLDFSGKVRMLRTTKMPYQFPGNESKFLVGVSVDITELKNYQSELESAIEIAEAASRAKSDFLANMSHEIRTPLNGVIGFTDLLMATDLNKTQRQYMSTVNQSAHSLLDVINDILDFSKIEAGKLELVPELIDLTTLITQVIDMIQLEAQKKNIEVLITMDEKTPRFILADPVRLKQVLMNLVGNAIKFTEMGEIELKVESGIMTAIDNPVLVDEKSSGKNYGLFRFSVRDTGIGINPENQTRIFTPFSQGESYTTKRFGGTGLGLNISNKLLEMMGSTLQLISTPGKGSTFYFDAKFQLSREQDGYLTSTQHNFETKQSSSVGSNEYKILIAEDNPVNMSLIKIILKNMLPNCILIEAADGRIALEKWEQSNPDLVFMDVQMPEMNGYESVINIRKLEKIRRYSPRTPIIALTAGTVVGEKEKCIDIGMDEYVSKPISAVALEKVLRQWLIKSSET